MAKSPERIALSVPTLVQKNPSFTEKKRIRKTFGRINEAIQMPNLIEVQRSSYEQFLQRDIRPANRIDDGLEAVFKSVFPVKTLTSAPCSNMCLMNLKTPSTMLKNVSNAISLMRHRLRSSFV